MWRIDTGIAYLFLFLFFFSVLVIFLLLLFFNMGHPLIAYEFFPVMVLVDVNVSCESVSILPVFSSLLVIYFSYTFLAKKSP